MNKTINIAIKQKIATNTSPGILYVCGNSDYTVNFAFDSEWGAFTTKTARFITDQNTVIDIIFRGNTCNMPMMQNTHLIKVGVFAGDLHTTTPAVIGAKKSILCGSGIPAEPAPDVYQQIMERMDVLEAGGASPEQIESAVQNYLEQNPVQGVSDEHIKDVTAEMLEEAKESGVFDGKDGADGKDGKDYILTDADKREIAGMVEVGGGGTVGGVTDDHINSLIHAALGVIENGAY